MTAAEGLIILGMAGVTFGVRYSLFALADRIRMASWIEASLKFIPPAVLSAIILPAVLLPRGEWELTVANPYLVAAAVTTAAGTVTRNMLATITIGLAAFFAFRLFALML